MIKAIELSLIGLFMVAWFLGMHFLAYCAYRQDEAERLKQ